MLAGNCRSFRWSKRSQRAALLVAEGQPCAEIAAAAGIKERQLRNWRAHPDFAARVDEISAELRAAVVAEGVVRRQNRVAALNERWLRLQRIIDARALEYADVPGGSTGLLVRTVKLVKIYTARAGDPDDGGQLVSAKLSEEISEYAVDTGLLRELRELERQAAEELGQWTEKREHTGELLIREYVGVSVDEV